MNGASDTLGLLTALWSKALGVKTIGPDDNFFALGGHSLLGVKLVAAMQEKLALDSELTLADLLSRPTLRSFCEHVESLAAPGEESGLL